MTTSHLTAISRNDIDQAVQVGEQKRKDRIEQEAHDREMALAGQIAEAPRRAAEILNELPGAIANVVAKSNETPRSFVVMWVEPHEYDGAVERNLGAGYHGSHPGYEDDLKLAARQVYDALADLKPELKFRSKDGAPAGKAQLAVIIRL